MWLIVHSVVVTVLSLSIVFGANMALVAAFLAAEGVVAFSSLFAEGGIPARRPANVVTAIRVVVGLVSLVALSLSIRPPAALATLLFWLLVVGEVSDFADGVVARRLGPSAFGARFDMESDAFFMLVLCLVSISWGFPRWLIIAGLLRYAVALPFFLLPETRFSRRFSIFAKTACATAAVALLVVAYPQMPDGLRLSGAFLAVGLLLVSFGWEALLRVSEAIISRKESTTGKSSGRLGMVRSFLTYYGVPFRLYRMKRFYRTLVRPGELVFDVGAHVGNRVRALRSLGARVVAVEPQAACVRLLHSLYGDDPDVSIEAVACGATGGRATLRVAPGHPTLSTLSTEWIESIDRHYGDLNITWDQSESVMVRTLDDLIGEYGLPSFIKIDVEGFEPEALAGLTVPIRTISFEFLPASPESALASLREIRRIGTYRFNYSLVESMQYYSASWMSADELAKVLGAMVPTGPSGDVYAVLEEPK